MPYYQFTVPAGGATLQHKAEVESLAIFIHEIRGANALEHGVILPEITEEPGAAS